MEQFWNCFLHPRTRYVLAWILAIGVALGMAVFGWIAFAEPQRRDGNSGHTQIDFGGQWLLARMLVAGHGHDLYNRDRQREVLHAAYPVDRQAPNASVSDADQLMGWMMGHDDPQAERRIGGPLYPPIHALVHAPIGLFSPWIAYRVLQGAMLLLCFVSAAGVCYLSRGHIWWPVAALGIMVYPGFSAAVNLGQNPVLTLTILIWGWAFLTRSWDGWGGILWGLLAFKPVWAMAFFLVLVLSRRWRACLAMLAAGAGLALLTVPLVGVQSWLDWLAVGREASWLYNVDINWIHSSRDLLSIPRRWLIDFDRPLTERDGLAPTLLGWAMLLFVLGLTTGLALVRRKEASATEGPTAAFLLLGAWLTCFHFMYYDVLLSILPIFLLFTGKERYLEPRLAALLPLSKSLLSPTVQEYFQPRPAALLPVPWPLLEARAGRMAVLNRGAPTLAALVLLSLYVPSLFRLTVDKVPPLDTYFLVLLWLWCGWRWWVEPQS